jgi:hypothetical protein
MTPDEQSFDFGAELWVVRAGLVEELLAIVLRQAQNAVEEVLDLVPPVGHGLSAAPLVHPATAGAYSACDDLRTISPRSLRDRAFGCSRDPRTRPIESLTMDNQTSSASSKEQKKSAQFSTRR